MAQETAKKFLLRRLSNRLLHLLARFGPGRLRVPLHRLRGVKIGNKVWIGDDVYLDNEYPEAIEIHDNSRLMLKAVVVAHTGGAGRVIIEKNVFIGATAMILCRGGTTVRIGEGAVIGAGCVIKSSVPPFILMMPPESKPVARITAPLASRGGEAFLAGLQPLATKSEIPQLDL